METSLVETLLSETSLVENSLYWRAFLACWHSRIMPQFLKVVYIQYTYGKGPFGNFGERHYSSQLVSLHSFLGLAQRYYTQNVNWGTICTVPAQTAEITKCYVIIVVFFK